MKAIILHTDTSPLTNDEQVPDEEMTEIKKFGYPSIYYEQNNQEYHNIIVNYLKLTSVYISDPAIL